MALDNNFYNEIFKKEAYWTELAKKGLLNIYYLNGKNSIKEFYLNKKAELEAEYKLTNNQIQEQFLNIIISIIDKIGILTDEYREGNNIDITSLTTIFLSNQMNNNENKEVKQTNTNKIKKEILEKLRNMYVADKRNEDDPNYDYLYEDFPDKQKTA